MKPEIEVVVELQTLDTRLLALQREIDALPKQVAAIERTLDSHIRKLELDRGALAANLKSRKQLEEDIKIQEQKISKLKDQLLQAKTNEQYRAFQHEIEFCEREIRKAEDKILDFMASAEPLDAAVKQAEQSLAGEKQKGASEQERARMRTAEDQEIMARLMAERKELAASVSPKTLSQYELIRKKRQGVAVSDATDGRCSACQIALRPQHFQDLKRGEGIVLCESCGRMLHYNPPVDYAKAIQQA